MRYTNIRGALLAVAALLALRAPGLGAQEPMTFRACYVPKVGAIYLLDLAGLPTECLSTEHREISWSEGPELVEGSVTGDLIADSAVDGSKIRGGSITNAHLAPGTLATVADGSIESRHLASGAVTSESLAPDAVTSPSIADDAVTWDHMAPNSVGDAQIRDQVVRSRHLRLFYLVERFTFTVPPGDTGTATLSCSSGREMLSVGLRPAGTAHRLLWSYPSETDTWRVGVSNSLTVPTTATVYAVCVDLS